MKSTSQYLIPTALAATLIAFGIASCCTKGPQDRSRPQVGDPLPPDCRPRPQLAQFNNDIQLVFNPDGLNNAAGYQWYQLKEDKFHRVDESTKYKNVTSNVLTITWLRPEDVAHYAFLKKDVTPVYKDAFCENRVFSLMGYSNALGTITVWGAPLTANNSSSANNCNGVQCPGTYTRTVDYDWGWRPIAGAPCSVQDGNTTTRPSTKIRYYGNSITPLCGCSPYFNIPGPNPSKVYTFTLYFPSTAAPQNPHPLVINNMNAEP